MTNGSEGKRSGRVQILKRLLTIFLFVGVILPLLLCILLFIKVDRLQQELQELKAVQAASAKRQIVEPTAAQEVLSEGQAGVMKIAGESSGQEAGGSKERAQEEWNGLTKVYLTFDDGPSSNTDAILDVLQQYDVKATFFVIGKPDQQYVPMYQRIVEDGHTLGMHSYSHKYQEIYASEEAFWADLDRLQRFLYDTTGVWSRFYRFPGGSSNEVSSLDMQQLTEELQQQDIFYLDWNVSGGDAVGKTLTAQQIADNVVQNVKEYKTAVVLLHDAKDKTATVEALPIIITGLLESGQVEFAAVDDEMHMVQHLKQRNGG